MRAHRPQCRYFNSIQSECFESLFYRDSSLVLAAPTGSGKTAILELAMLRVVSRFVTQSGQFVHQKGMVKIIYLCPTKALVQEKVKDWRDRFGVALKLSVKELTGDTEQDELGGVESADIICATPEKFDAMTRRNRARGGMRFFNEVLFVKPERCV